MTRGSYLKIQDLRKEDFRISKSVANDKALEAMVVQANALEVKLA